MENLSHILLHYIPAKRKSTPSGWISFNAPCCIHNGYTKDTRGRGGINISTDIISFHCFNCGFKCSWKNGNTLSKKFQKFLSWLNVPDDNINLLVLDLFKNKDKSINYKQENILPKFNNIKLPEDFTKLDKLNSTHKDVFLYLEKRNLNADNNFFVSNNLNYKNRLIIPFTYHNNIVGYTARSVNNKNPKYITNSQPGFVFGIDNQIKNDFIILCEGPIDALLVDGVSVLGSSISTQQLTLIQSLNKKIILVPDRDKAGLKLLKDAIDNQWYVSMPPWANEIKDIGDAVDKYGKLLTMYSIMKFKEQNELKIRLGAKKWFL